LWLQMGRPDVQWLVAGPEQTLVESGTGLQTPVLSRDWCVYTVIALKAMRSSGVREDSLPCGHPADQSHVVWVPGPPVLWVRASW
jgi:hypothetical protein